MNFFIYSNHAWNIEFPHIPRRAILITLRTLQQKETQKIKIKCPLSFFHITLQPTTTSYKITLAIYFSRRIHLLMQDIPYICPQGRQLNSSNPKNQKQITTLFTCNITITYSTTKIHNEHVKIVQLKRF